MNATTEASHTITTGSNPPALTDQIVGVSLMSDSDSVDDHIAACLAAIEGADHGYAETWERVSELHVELAAMKAEFKPHLDALIRLARQGHLTAERVASIGGVLIPRGIAGIKEIRSASGADPKEVWRIVNALRLDRLRRNSVDVPRPERGEYGVYTLHDMDGAVVYVGRSIDIWNRLNFHEREKPNEWVTWEWMPCPDDKTMRELEAELIVSMSPSLNKRREFPK
jgi:hypothetical protein